jgi:hypothetical protein
MMNNMFGRPSAALIGPTGAANRTAAMVKTALGEQKVMT